MVRDAKRDADEILNSAVDESVKKDVLSATNNWLKKHSNVSYGSDLKEYEDLKDVFENAKKAAGKNVTTPQYDQKQESDKGANWLVYVIPTIIFIGIIIFILYKKSKTVKEIEYPTFDEYGRE
jgi:ATP-dependent Zn protease